MTTHACPQGERPWALYEEGEAAPLGAHIRECRACRARAAAEAPEALFALLAEPPRDFATASPTTILPFAVPRETQRPWLSGMRQAASLLLVAGCAWGGYLLYRGNVRLAYAPSALTERVETAGVEEDLHARYPLVRHESPAVPSYTTTLADGTRLVHFHVPEL